MQSPRGASWMAGRWKQGLGGLAALLLLTPVPVFGALSFDTWISDTSNFTLIDDGNSTNTFTLTTPGSGGGHQVITFTSSVSSDNPPETFTAAFNGFNAFAFTG